MAGRPHPRALRAFTALVLLHGASLAFPTVAAAQGTATVSGRVTNVLTGAPIQSVSLTISDYQGNSRYASTDASGQYSFTAPAGTYYLYTYNAQHYVNQTYGGVNCTGFCSDRGGAFTLAANETRQIDLALQPGAAIEGQVIDALTGGGMYVGGVSLYDAAHRGIGGANVDSAGRFRMDGGASGALPTGTYYLAVPTARPGYVGVMFDGIQCAPSCRLADATPVKAVSGQTTYGIAIRVPRAPVLSGRVTDAATGAPLGGVFVLTRPVDSFYGLYNGAFGLSDASGNYALAPAPGRYYVFVTSPPPGYVSQVYSGVPLPCTLSTVSPACDRDLESGTIVTVAAGQASPGIDFRLRRGGGIAGRVSDQVTGGGTPGRVIVYTDAGVLASTADTAPDGTYTISGLAPGAYVAIATRNPTNFNQPEGAGQLYNGVACPFRACAVTSGTRIAVAAGAVTSGIDFALPAAGGISGSLTVPGGGTVTNPVVELFAGDVRLTTAYTATFSFTTLAPGAYRLKVTAPGYITQWYGGGCDACGDRGSPITVSAGATATANVSLSPAAIVTGQITPAVPSGGFGVQAVRADGTIVATSGVVSGRYTIDTLPSGTFYFRFVDQIAYSMRFGPYGGDYPDQLYNRVPCESVECPLDGATPVSVTAGGSTTGIDFVLEERGQISGRIRLEGDPIVGTSVSFLVGVRAYTSEGRPAGNYFPLGDTYYIKGLRPGTYYLRTVSGFGHGYANQIYRNLTCAACSPLLGTPVVVTAATVRSNIDFLLLPAGSIAGTIRGGPSGDPLENVTVNAFTEAGKIAGTTTTDRLGNYVVQDLAAGRYVLATSNVEGYADEVFDDLPCGSCDPSRGRLVDVSGGSRLSGIDFTLVRGALVTGRVADPGDNGVGGATVSFFNATGAMVARTESGPTGQFAASIPPGTTYARLDAKAHVTAALYDGKPCPNGACDVTTGTPITAAAAAILRGIDFRAISCGLATLTPSTLPPARTGASYAATFSTSPSSSSRYAIVRGSLPPGLALDPATGALSGTPTTAGESTFTVSGTDGAGCVTSRDYTLSVIGCTPVLTTTTFDVPGKGITLTLTTGGACQPAPTINVPWIAAGRIFPGDPVSREFVVALNPGGRRTGTVTIGNRVVTVNQASAVSLAPFGRIDTPLDGANVAGSIAIGGWALDDLKVVNVVIQRAALPGEGTQPVFLGYATLVPGARPDVEALYQELPYANRAGWGYLLLTNMLPNQGNGVFTILAVAEDVEGNRVLLGTKTIVANNSAATKPFGAIDTPGQGETIVGRAYVNYGWALTPKPKTIPTDGSTIRVLLDGVDVGSVDYNHFRSDVAGLFPGLNNSSGPVGFRMIDTTTLPDGIHTIAWIVTDNAGAAEGIGSRYFTVNNTGAAQNSVLAPPATAASLAGPWQIRVRPLERIVLDLGVDGSCAATYEGVEQVRDEARPLPVGSSLDAATGRFTWQPGPGFLGTFHLAFTVTDCAGRRRVDVDVTIDPDGALGR